MRKVDAETVKNRVEVGRAQCTSFVVVGFLGAMVDELKVPCMALPKGPCQMLSQHTSTAAAAGPDAAKPYARADGRNGARAARYDQLTKPPLRRAGTPVDILPYQTVSNETSVGMREGCV